MSPESVISARGLGKAYRIYDRPADRLWQMLPGRRRKLYRDFWALRGIDLEVLRGETVGIVGRNGSGKSTFLQLVCGLLDPTEGTLQVNGRIAALLELGTGFNPEFTGRENIYLYGEIMGIERREMARRFEAIAEFADIGDFIDQPVRSYSSGMQARVGFAVAIHVDPDILIVDEALSVGDEVFQRKCFSRIEQIRSRGATILFVSHGAQTVVELCSRAVLLHEGRQLLTGDPKTVIGWYQRLANAPPDRAGAVVAQLVASGEADASGAAIPVANGGEAASPGTNGPDTEMAPDAAFDPSLQTRGGIEYVSQGARITGPHLVDETGAIVNLLVQGATYRYRYTVSFEADCDHVQFGMMLKTVSGVEISGMTSGHDVAETRFVPRGTSLVAEFRFRNLLNPGTYFLNAGVGCLRDGKRMALHRLLDAAMFRVLPAEDRFGTGYVCLGERPHFHVEFESDVRPHEHGRHESDTRTNAAHEA